MLGEMRPMTFPDYANFPSPTANSSSGTNDGKSASNPAASGTPSSFPWSVSVGATIDEDGDATPPPLPPRLPRHFSNLNLPSATATATSTSTSTSNTNPFRAQTAVTRSQSLKTPETSTFSFADMDANHRRRSVRLSCGGGLLAAPGTTSRTAVVDFSASCPPTPTPTSSCSLSSSSVSGSVFFKSTPDCNVRVTVNVDVTTAAAAAEGAGSNNRYRYPFQPLIVGPPSRGSSPTRDAKPLQHQHQHPFSSPEDVDCVSSTQRRLRASGFYWEGVSWHEAVALLARRPEGTFVVRDSQDPRFLFSLSVQTRRGPTSVRIHYDSGEFYLDAARNVTRDAVPRRACVVDLVDHYVSVCDAGRLGTHVWLDKNGDTFDQVRLRTPLLKEVPSLKHAARLAFNRASPSGSSERTEQLKRVPAQIRRFLEEYPSAR